MQGSKLRVEYYLIFSSTKDFQNFKAYMYGDQDFYFCGGSEKNSFERLHKGLFKIILELLLQGRISFFFSL